MALGSTTAAAVRPATTSNRNDGGASRGEASMSNAAMPLPPRSEFHAERSHEHLVVRPRVEPVAPDGHGAPRHLRERAALEFPFTSVRASVLAHHADAQPRRGAEAELAPRVGVAVAPSARGDVFGLDVEVDRTPCEAGLD